jgi:hypothetical protein
MILAKIYCNMLFASYESGKFPSAKKLVLEMNEATGSEGKVSVFRIFKPMDLSKQDAITTESC